MSPGEVLATDEVPEDVPLSVIPAAVAVQEAPVATLDLGESIVLDLSLVPDGVSIASGAWISEDPIIATVDTNGTVLAKNTGETQIIYLADTGDTLAVYPIAVTAVVDAAYQGNIGPIIEGLDLEGITKVMIVAHPDDETLWGGAHLYGGGWLVICLSNLTTDGGVHAPEFANIVSYFGCKGIILDYSDNDAWIDAPTIAYITQDVSTVLGYQGIQWELVATHNPNGDYGHSHHRSASDITTRVYDSIFPGEDKLWYFGRYLYSPDAIAQLPPLTQVDSDGLAAKTYALFNIYTSQNFVVDGLLHIFPYENWVKRTDWNGDGTHSADELFGETRFETAVAVAEEAYPDTAQGVIIATAYNFPDALTASSLAGLLDYPILFTDPGWLTQSTEDEIVALGAQKVIIVGGTSVVSEAAEAELKMLVGSRNVERISGIDRYGTASAIYTYGSLSPLGWSTTAIVACGTNFPDALSISSLAANEHFPVFLAQANGLLSASDEAILARDFDAVIIVGGTGVVSSGVETQLQSLGVTDVTRLAGSERYATSCEIAEWCVSQGYLSWDGAGFATGIDYPDALAAGALQGKKNSVLLLTDLSAREDITMQVVPDLRYLDPSYAASMGSVCFFGGWDVFQPPLRTSILAALSWSI
ncbi:MAG: hypothetical protein HGA54_03730 [Actinobacteria bacterium]|nr:hypothetical protein [Actinomycetota bacterium]